MIKMTCLRVPAYMVFAIGTFAQILFAQGPMPTPSPTPPEEDGEVIRVNSKLVQMETIVKDKKGNLVKDLTAEDFELAEDGKVRPIEFFSYVPIKRSAQSGEVTSSTATNGIKAQQVKRTFVFLVSNPDIRSTVMINTNQFAEVKTYSYQSFTLQGLKSSVKLLNKFINESMSFGDLVSINDTEANLGTLSNFTNDKEVLLAAVRQMEESVKQGKYATHNITGTYRSRTDTELNAGDLITQNLNTLMMAESAVNQLEKLPGQKLVFLLSRGMLGARSINGADVVEERLKKLIERANQAKVTFYSLGLKTLGEGSMEVPPPPGAVQSSDFMRQLAEKTGGRGIFNTNDPSVRFQELLEENSGYYQLAFSPDENSSPRAYKVEIRLKRPGLTAQYRSSVYYNTAVNEAVDSKQRILKLLRMPFTNDAVKVKLATSFLAKNKKEGTITTVVRIDPALLEPNIMANGQREIKLDLGIRITEPDNFVARQDVKNFSLKLSEESWQQILKEGLNYQFETATRKPGTHLVKIAACINESNICGNAESNVNVK
jgi:VWFA-related protein